MQFLFLFCEVILEAENLTVPKENRGKLFSSLTCVSRTTLLEQRSLASTPAQTALVYKELPHSVSCPVLQNNR